MIDSVDLNIFLDWCGICGGDNSTCKEERGVYNRTEYGYNSVVRIPSGKFTYWWYMYIYRVRFKSVGFSMVIQFLIFVKGAINIDIRQYGYHRNSNDDTYIALRDIDTGEYILNGDFVMSMFRKTIQYGGTTLEYSVCLSLLIILW